MPVIRGPDTTLPLPKERRKALLQQLRDERAGKITPDGPVIFEMPHHHSHRIDVVVVWDEWDSVSMEERDDLIEAAYKDQKEKLSLTLGVTYQEARERNILPYEIVPRSKRKEDQPQIREAMLAEGGMPSTDNKVELRMPTMAMAEAAAERLGEKLPQVCWSIVQS